MQLLITTSYFARAAIEHNKTLKFLHKSGKK